MMQISAEEWEGRLQEQSFRIPPARTAFIWNKDKSLFLKLFSRTMEVLERKIKRRLVDMITIQWQSIQKFNRGNQDKRQ